MKTLSKILLWIPLVGILYYLFYEKWNYLVQENTRWDKYQTVSALVVVFIVVLAIGLGITGFLIWCGIRLWA